MSRISNSGVATLVERCHKEIDDGLLPSCQIALALDGEVVELHTIGDTPAGDATRYVAFSASKAIVSAAVLQLLGEGKVRLADRVCDYVPAFKTNGKDGVTIEHLLLHTGGFPTAPMTPPDWWTRDGRTARFAQWRLTSAPGETYQYHITSAHWVLAELLETVDGLDHREVIRRRIAEPLGLTQFALGVAEADQEGIAEVAVVGEEATPEELMATLGIDHIDRGEVTDEALAAFARPDVLALGVPGGGLVCNAGDFARFYQGVLHNPDELWDPGVLRDATTTVRIDAFDAIRWAPAGRTLAFMIAGSDGHAAARGFGHTSAPRCFGQDGMGGQIAFVDPETGLSVSYLTNGLDRHLLRQQRRRVSIANKVAGCIV